MCPKSIHEKRHIKGQKKHGLSSCISGNARFSNQRDKQSGSMIVMALFIIIVLTVLAATMINVINNSSSTVINEVYGLRAQQAAKTGLEALVSQSFPIGSAPQSCSSSITSDAAFSNIPGFAGCQFQARCTTEVINRAGLSYNYYKYESIGSCELQDGIVSRTLSVDAMQEL